jgi:hypothetical protein
MTMNHEHPQFLPYAAGFFDGEGCVGIYGSRKRLTLRVCTSVANTDKAVIDMFVSRWGGGIRVMAPRKSNHRTLYTWRTNTAAAIAVLRELRPFLVVKAEQVDCALEFNDKVLRKWGRSSGESRADGHRGSPGLSDEEKANRIKYADRMKALKGRLVLKLAS